MEKGCWRKWLGLLVAVVLMIGVLPSEAESQEAGRFAGGMGTQTEPYLIEDAEQLAALASWVNELGESCSGLYFRLEQDLTLSGSWTPIGGGSQAFSGHFDGNGHTISGLKISNNVVYGGLFGKIDGGSIEDLAIQNCYIMDQQYVGAIAGMITNSSLSGCSTVGGEIHGSSMVGGLVGCMTGESRVDGCENTALNKSKLHNIGGIAGYVKDTGNIINCCNQGDIIGKENVGGIVGASDRKSNICIKNCYNKGTIAASVTGEGAALLGKTSHVAPMAYCYYDAASSERAYIATGVINSDQISAVDENGRLVTPVTYENQQYHEVTAALNAWVDGQGEDYRHWRDDGLCTRYEVLFVDETGELLSAVWGEEGRLLTEPLMGLTKKGYSFAGWSADGQEPWHFTEDVLMKALVLAPLWEPEQISVEPAEITVVGRIGQQERLYDLTTLKILHDSDGQKQYRLQMGQQLPQGLYVTPEGLLTGVPTEAVQDQTAILIVRGANGTEAAVTLYLTIQPIEREKFRIRTQTTAGGVILPQEVWLAQGEQQTFTIKADPGYAVKEVLLDGLSLGVVDRYTLTDIQAEHCLTARFVWRGTAEESGDGGYDQDEPDVRDQAPLLLPAREIPAKEEHAPGGDYTDTAGHWAAESIDFVSAKGLMTGTAPGRFGPDETVSRGTLAVIFWRMAGEPSVKTESVFQDVDQEQWYAQAVAWAAEQGVMVGRSAEEFQPEDALTRQELAVLLYRWANGKADKRGDWLQQYKDGGETAPWAVEAMNWAAANAILKGRSPDLLQPQESLSRAEMAAVLQRFMEWKDGSAEK